MGGHAHQLPEVLWSGPLSGERKADTRFTSDQQEWQSKVKSTPSLKAQVGSKFFFYDNKTIQANYGKHRIFRKFIY